jgi:2-polyprenyl-3-methyl-5-hydroxy-6-metoxy-1,4-benzoquinol methylase
VLCGGVPASPREKLALLGLSQCINCGLVFQAEWEDGFDETLYDYYSKRTGLSADEVYPAVNQIQATKLLGDLQHLVSGKRLLDVGCGTGGLVRTATGLGWEALGIDLSHAAVELCRQHDVRAQQTSFFDSTLDNATFDLIVMSELIEHVANPLEFLRRANELLAVGGALYLTTPNWASLGRRVLGTDWRPLDPEHLSYFTPRTLRRAADQAGLSVRSLKTVNITPTALRRLVGLPVDMSEARAKEQQLRYRLNVSTSGVIAKRALNLFLGMTQLGDTIKAVMTIEESSRLPNLS